MKIDFYSPLLIVAIAGLAVLIAGLVMQQFAPDRLPRGLISNSGRIALAAVIAACLDHFVFGHRPGSVEALGLMDFVLSHPAPLVIAGLTGFGLALWRQ